ncbi:MAG: PEGA domain-containing protein [Deltaproteobacteria bacterium]|nr:PEGA domain-containing protein [Deltaproteobacteria bacterium]
MARTASADTAEEDAARVHLNRGVAAFERGDYVAAHAEIEAANKLVPAKANPYRWLALTEVQLGDCARARGNIETFLERVAAADPRRAEMLRLRELCSRTGSLAIRTTPPNAQLRIDRAHVGTAPYRSGSFAVGDHTVAAEAPGYRPLSRAFAITAGGAVDLHLELSRPRTPITRRWWFVPALVGVAAAVTGAIAVFARDDRATLFPGVTCGASGCRPGGP